MTFAGNESQRPAAETALTGDVRPLPDGLIAHPRSGGCFSRTFSWLVRDTGALGLVDAVRRCTLTPATVLADAAPAMRAKGRIQTGADADICVFDPDTIAPQGDYQHLRPSMDPGYAESGAHLVAAAPSPKGNEPSRALHAYLRWRNHLTWAAIARAHSRDSVCVVSTSRS